MQLFSKNCGNLQKKNVFTSNQSPNSHFSPPIKMISKKKSLLSITFNFYTFRPEILVFSKKKGNRLKSFLDFRPKIVAFPQKKIFTSDRDSNYPNLGLASNFSNFILNRYHLPLIKKYIPHREKVCHAIPKVVMQHMTCIS